MNRGVKYFILGAVLLSIAGGFLFLFERPLLPSKAYTITASLNGVPIHAELLHPSFASEVYYVRLPDARPGLYQWFGIAFRRLSVFIPAAVYTGWYDIPYVHSDQLHGVNITDGKIEDHWSVKFSPAGVQFSNGSFSIALQPNL
ncbi:MAG: hypothetical protein ABIP97_03980 [Chthoniobacterales bacterium]